MGGQAGGLPGGQTNGQIGSLISGLMQVAGSVYGARKTAGKNDGLVSNPTPPSLPPLSKVEPEWRYTPPTLIQNQTSQQPYLDPFIMQQYYLQNSRKDWDRR